MAQNNGLFMVFLNYSIQLLRKSHTFRVILQNIIFIKNFMKNFPTLESRENLYIKVYNDDEHEYRLSFIITIILNTV